MKNLILMSLFIGIALSACKNDTAPLRSMAMPQDFTVYWNEDSVAYDNITSFVRQHDKTMFALFNADCSSCLVGVSLWLQFAKEHPEITPVFATYTEQTPRSFWIQTYTYYTPPLYVFFDKEFKFFLANKIIAEHDTFIVDSAGNVLLEGSIYDKKFEKLYRKLKKQSTLRPCPERGLFVSKKPIK